MVPCPPPPSSSATPLFSPRPFGLAYAPLVQSMESRVLGKSSPSPGLMAPESSLHPWLPPYITGPGIQAMDHLPMGCLDPTLPPQPEPSVPLYCTLLQVFLLLCVPLSTLQAMQPSTSWAWISLEDITLFPAACGLIPGTLLPL